MLEVLLASKPVKVTVVVFIPSQTGLTVTLLNVASGLTVMVIVVVLVQLAFSIEVPVTV